MHADTSLQERPNVSRERVITKAARGDVGADAAVSSHPGYWGGAGQAERKKNQGTTIAEVSAQVTKESINRCGLAKR